MGQVEAVSTKHGNELWLMDNKSNYKPPGYKPLVVKVIVVGPFEEEEEGTSVASDVVKVECEDLDTPVYLRGDKVRLGRQRSRIVGASPLARS